MKSGKNRLLISESLRDGDDINTYRFCAPIFITHPGGIFFSTLYDDYNLLQESKKNIKNATVTFLQYENEYFAVTCKHVLDILLKEREDLTGSARTRGELKKELINFIIPKDDNHFHLNYEFTAVPLNVDGSQPDIAIARIELSFIQKIGREPIKIYNLFKDFSTGIASGYPEEQRKIFPKENANWFAPLFITCLAKLKQTAKGELVVESTIEPQNPQVDNLRRMSRRPIIWTDGKSYGFTGITKKGLPIHPPEDGINTNQRILIRGEKITKNYFSDWLKCIPPMKKTYDLSKKFQRKQNINISIKSKF